MGTVIFTGNAQADKQVNTITPASVTIGNIFTVTINGKAISFTATAATVANVTAGLVNAIQSATSYPEFGEVTAADNTTNLTLTANTAGTPFTQTSSAATGAGTPGCTLVTSTTTANSGPNVWNLADNWDTGVVPVTGDDVYIDQLAIDILYGLDQSAVTLATLNIGAGYTGKIGLPQWNVRGYWEYRDTYLAIGATALTIGDGPGSGSGRIKIDTGSVQTAITVEQSAAGADTGIEAILWKGTHASNTLVITKGEMACAGLAGEVATLSSVEISSKLSPATDVYLRLSSGCTLTTVTQLGGKAEINSNTTTLTLKGQCTCTVAGTATLGTVTLDQGATLVNKSSGTLATALKVGPGCTVDYSQDPRAKTITPLVELSKGSIWKDPNAVVTYTAGLQTYRCTLADVKIDVGAHRTYSVA